MENRSFFKVRGEIIHVRINWQSNFEVMRSKTKVTDSRKVEKGGGHVESVIAVGRTGSLIR